MCLHQKIIAAVFLALAAAACGNTNSRPSTVQRETISEVSFNDSDLLCRILTVRVATITPMLAGFRSLGATEEDIARAHASLRQARKISCGLSVRIATLEARHIAAIDGELEGYLAIWDALQPWEYNEILATLELYDKLHQAACKISKVDIRVSKAMFEEAVADLADCDGGDQVSAHPPSGFAPGFRSCYEDFLENTRMEPETCGIAQAGSEKGQPKNPPKQTEKEKEEEKKKRQQAKKAAREKYLQAVKKAKEAKKNYIKTATTASIANSAALITAAGAAILGPVGLAGGVTLIATTGIGGALLIAEAREQVIEANEEVGKAARELLNLNQLCLAPSNGVLAANYRRPTNSVAGAGPQQSNFLTAYDALEHCVCETKQAALSKLTSGNLLSQMACETSEEERRRMLCARDPYENPSPGPSPSNVFDWYNSCRALVATDLQAAPLGNCSKVICPSGSTAFQSLIEGESSCACIDLNYTPIPAPQSCAEACLQGQTCVCDPPFEPGGEPDGGGLGSVGDSDPNTQAVLPCRCEPTQSVFQIPGWGGPGNEPPPCNPELGVPCPETPILLTR